MRVVDVQQGSPEWLAARCGLVTASRISDLMAKTKSGWGASRANYAAQLVAERLTGTVAESYTNAAMQWGRDLEPEAAAAYGFFCDQPLTTVGLVLHPTIEQAGASPDRLVGDEGLVEIKCPQTATQIDTLLGEKVPEKYILQMQFQMACTGRQWCDFVSYDPRLPGEMALFVKRIQRDEAVIRELESEVSKFLNEVSTTVSKLLEKYQGRAAA
jgi:putative phage-type endonuclease